MRTFLRVLTLFSLGLAFQAAPQVPCVRSFRCKTQKFQGCYAVEGMCYCSLAHCCVNPFKYPSLDSCLAVEENTLRFEDPCERNPCKNDGFCVQLSGTKHPGYRCECHGTGFFGPRCQKKCPKDVRKTIKHRLSESKNKSSLQKILDLFSVCRL